MTTEPLDTSLHGAQSGPVSDWLLKSFYSSLDELAPGLPGADCFCVPLDAKLVPELLSMIAFATRGLLFASKFDSAIDTEAIERIAQEMDFLSPCSGDKGDKGDKGDAGPSGPSGTSGPAGPSGPSGASGSGSSGTGGGNGASGSGPAGSAADGDIFVTVPNCAQIINFPWGSDPFTLAHQPIRPQIESIAIASGHFNPASETLISARLSFTGLTYGGVVSSATVFEHSFGGFNQPLPLQIELPDNSTVEI